jgi:hypothetical protein
MHLLRFGKSLVLASDGNHSHTPDRTSNFRANDGNHRVIAWEKALDRTKTWARFMPNNRLHDAMHAFLHLTVAPLAPGPDFHVLTVGSGG